MLRSTVRAILGIAFAALATWATNWIIDRIFGPEELEGGSA